MNTWGAVSPPETAPITRPRTLLSSGISIGSKPLPLSRALASTQNGQPGFENTTTWSGFLAWGAT
ncbi:Uncharacterised protein [Bordetella pertussis]|nr:Uncharacterised protein [Bordetella pertussis]CPM66021.1 Uncharacterised protein [Bordetella pertussis]